LIDHELLDLIERFQTMITGALGFIGVIWTLRANARYAKELHQRQIDTKRNTLRRILAAEFRNYSRALRDNLKARLPIDEQFSVGRVNRVFSESLAADLGSLEPGEVDVVVNALISLDGLNHFLENISQTHSDTRYLIPVAVWDEFCRGVSTTADALDAAIDVLESATSEL